MESFWKLILLVLVSVVLTTVVGRQEKEIALLLSMIVCCGCAMAMFSYLEPVLDLLRELEKIGQLQEGVLGMLLKAAGIALATELAGMICSDGGNASLARTLQILGSSAVLYVSIPIFRGFLSLIQEILGRL